eukprot:6498822-Pyramimonas_sp.AAC.1
MSRLNWASNSIGSRIVGVRHHTLSEIAGDEVWKLEEVETGKGSGWGKRRPTIELGGGRRPARRPRRRERGQSGASGHRSHLSA